MRPNEISPADIANAMKMNVGELLRFAHNIEAFYKPPRKAWIGRKHRPIDALYKAPKRKLRLLHRWFQQQLLAHPRAHGGVVRRSCFTSADRHLGKRYDWIRDASDCYPSVTPKALQTELKALGFRHDTASLLTMLLTVRGHVPQGSPVSGDAINLFFWRIDQASASFCGQNHLGYTRVADDFVVSGNDRSSGFEAVLRIENELADRGIRVNKKKREKNGFQPNAGRQLVHSILVNRRRGTAVSPDHREAAIQIARKYVDACRSIQPDSIEGVAYKRSQLQGWMYYCRQATYSPALHLKKQLATGDRLVHRRLGSLKLVAYQNKWWLVTKKRNEPRRLANLWRRRLISLPASARLSRAVETCSRPTPAPASCKMPTALTRGQKVACRAEPWKRPACKIANGYEARSSGDRSDRGNYDANAVPATAALGDPTIKAPWED